MLVHLHVGAVSFSFLVGSVLCVNLCCSQQGFPDSSKVRDSLRTQSWVKGQLDRGWRCVIKGQCFHQPRLWKLRVGEHNLLRLVCQEGMEPFSTSPMLTLPNASSMWPFLSCILYNKSKDSAFLSSWSCSSNCTWVKDVRTMTGFKVWVSDNKLHLWLVSEAGAILQNWVNSPVYSTSGPCQNWTSGHWKWCRNSVSEQRNTFFIAPRICICEGSGAFLLLHNSH